MSDVQIIVKDGNPEYAVVPYDEWQRLRRVAEEAEEVRAYDGAIAEARDEETVPAEVVDRLLDGENPVRVWREYRGLQQQALAEQVGVSKSYLSQVESGRKDGAVGLYRQLSRVLEVSIDELIGWRED